MCLQFLSVYRYTFSFLPAYRSNALPKNCLLTVGWQPLAWAEDALGASLIPRAPTRATPRTPATTALVTDPLGESSFAIITIPSLVALTRAFSE